MSDSLGHDVYEARLTEIGRITTTWAKFEHWIEQAIWILAEVDARKGACMTTQIGPIHGKFRALIALMSEAQRSEDAMRTARQLSEEAAKIVQIRTRFAHGPLDMGINFDTREFEIYLRRVGVRRGVEFETVPLTHEDLVKAQAEVSGIYEQLREKWPLIVGTDSPDALAPPYK